MCPRGVHEKKTAISDALCTLNQICVCVCVHARVGMESARQLVPQILYTHSPTHAHTQKELLLASMRDVIHVKMSLNEF